MMNRYNAKLNAFMVEQLQLTSIDRVLEVGFGGGVALPSLIAGAGYVAGVDRSPDVVQQANARFADAVSKGRAQFRAADVEALPFETAIFNKACTANTIYFWTSLSTGFAELHRVLSPGGRLVVGFLPKEWMDRMGFPPDIFTTRAPDEVIAALNQAGFQNVRVERPQPTTRWNVIVATKNS
jgi:ubiquinone/menaquinone biosynthesis C-methylase UbiE